MSRAAAGKAVASDSCYRCVETLEHVLKGQCNELMRIVREEAREKLCEKLRAMVPRWEWEQLDWVRDGGPEVVSNNRICEVSQKLSRPGEKDNWVDAFWQQGAWVPWGERPFMLKVGDQWSVDIERITEANIVGQYPERVAQESKTRMLWYQLADGEVCAEEAMQKGPLICELVRELASRGDEAVEMAMHAAPNAAWDAGFFAGQTH